MKNAEKLQVNYVILNLKIIFSLRGARLSKLFLMEKTAEKTMELATRTNAASVS